MRRGRAGAVARRAGGSVALLALLAFAGGCRGGEGWATGRVVLSRCLGGDGLDDDAFDLAPDLFLGDIVTDPAAPDGARPTTLTLRIQNGGPSVAATDALIVQLRDVALAAARVRAGGGICLVDHPSCPRPAGAVIRPAARAQVVLGSRCPDNRAPLTASVAVIGAPEVTPAGTCRRAGSDAKGPPPCPDLARSPDTRRALRELCDLDGAYDDPALAPRIRDLLGKAGACLFLCRLGNATDPGVSSASFTPRRGDEVAGIFTMGIADARARAGGGCVRGHGRLTGMFRVTVRGARGIRALP